MTIEDFMRIGNNLFDNNSETGEAHSEILKEFVIKKITITQIDTIIYNSQNYPFLLLFLQLIQNHLTQDTAHDFSNRVGNYTPEKGNLMSQV
jgi:hypothetical protein